MFSRDVPGHDHGPVTVKVTVALPVVMPCGSTLTVYVPVVGSESGPNDPLVLLHMPPEPRLLPSGFRMLTTTALQPVYVEPVVLTLADCPVTPLKVYSAFWPGVVVVTLTGVPDAMVPVTSEKEFRRTVTLPVVVPCGSTRTV